tara:strand:+ start:203 stop:727 length:525 start_codon:yes stop_codon:yes gene_type:complete
MKILCSGNPDHKTIANGIKQVYPEADFASRTTGYDLRFWNKGSEHHFRKQIVNYNVFINASFVCTWGQHQLLEVTHEMWSKSNIHGYIVNIGSTSELLGIDSKFGNYTAQKRALQTLSLMYNNKSNIKSSHIVLGGFNNGDPAHANWLPVKTIAETIKYVLEHTANIPIIGLDN